MWLAEDDLGCIICHELLARPATLPCGHSFSRDCLMGLWGAGRHGSCRTCREGAERPLQLRKNTMPQDLEDKYSREARELEGPSPAPGPSGRTAQLPVGRRDQRLPSDLHPPARADCIPLSPRRFLSF